MTYAMCTDWLRTFLIGRYTKLNKGKKKGPCVWISARLASPFIFKASSGARVLVAPGVG